MNIVNLKILRKSRGYSQQALAEKLGIKQQQYARYEGGVNEINLKMFLKILKACNYEIKIEEKK